MRPVLLLPFSLLSMTLVVASPALAVDGVLEINQTCAVQTGCFAGDAPGFPVRLTVSGSYRVTSNIDFPGATASAIELAASDIAIDLNGHTIKGTNTCTTGPGGWVTSCSQSNGYHAILGWGSVRVRVSNGRILGSGGAGIILADGSEVRDVQVSDCGGEGIVLGSRSSASSVSAIGNRWTGIAINPGFGVVRDSLATNNGSSGFETGTGSTVSDNVSGGNGGGGILASSGSSVSGNTVRDNGSFGLSLSGGATYRDNTISNNTGAAVAGSGFVNAGGNSCNGSLTCP